MALAVSKAGRLKPEIRLAQTLSEYEAILEDEQKARLRGYRQESPPTTADVMRLTADIDRAAVRTRKSRRCVGPRLYNFLQAVQMFTGVVDIVVGGAQSLTASAIWGVVKLSLQLTFTVPAYFEQLSTLFMSIGRTCPRNQEYLLLYPRSVELKEAVCEYFVVTVQLCRQAVLFLKKPLLGQLFAAMSNSIMSELSSFEQNLDRLASAVAAEVSLASKRLQAQEAEHNSNFRLTALATSSQSKKWRNEQMEMRFLEACSTYDYQTAWKQIRKQGNVEWFLRHQAYTDWITKTISSVLHCVGTLGSGKSVLMANMIDDLFLRHPTPFVVYFFCRYDEPRSLSARTILGSITRQILTHLKPNMSKLASGCEMIVMGTDELLDALLRVLSTRDSKAQCFCIVLDGVDECKEADAQIVLQWLNRLFKSSFHNFHMVCSSRPDVFQWIFKVLPPGYMLSMSASGCREQMTSYVVDALEESLDTGRLSIGNPDIITKIRDTLLNNAHGMYLWMVLQIDNICSQPTDNAILQALDHIPKDLPETFNRILTNLRTSKEYAPNAAYSVTLFHVVAAARRPLTLDELREAVSVEQGETAWDPGQLVNDMQKLLKCCGSLLVVDEENFTVRFIHQSVRQFLCSELVNEGVKEYRMDLASADLDLGKICVTYLHSERHVMQLVKQEPPLITSSDVLKKIIPESNLAGKLAIRLLGRKADIKHNMRPSLEHFGAVSQVSHPGIQLYTHFLPYVQENWLYHTRQLNFKNHFRIWSLWKRLVAGKVRVVRLPWATENCFELGPKFTNFVLQTRQWNLIYVSLVQARTGALSNLKPIYDALKIDVLNISREEPTTFTTGVTDERQLITLLEPFLGHPITSTLLKHRLVLHAAASYGYVDSVRCLLDHGADVSLQDGLYGTALLAASSEGHEEIVRLLLEKGADVNLQSGHYESALGAASYYGHEEVVKLLLEKGADVNLQGGDYGSALGAASYNGRGKVVKLLLEKGANVNLQGSNYGSALGAASYSGHEEVVKLLLEKGADVNLQRGNLGSALGQASYNGRGKVVKLLSEKGADLNLQGGNYGSALGAASYRGKEEVVKLLLEKGADVNLQISFYGSALGAASCSGEEEVVKLLLEKGADPNLQTSSYGSALGAASYRGKEEVVKLLLEKGADVNLQSGIYGSALGAASCSGQEKVLKLLLEKGADVNLQGGIYGSALGAASYSGHEEVVRLLLKKGADVNLQGGDYGSALGAASYSGLEEVVRLLLKEGADVNLQGGDYGSALGAARGATWLAINGNDKIVRLLLKHGATSE